tara:strand:- start:251 stop:838 length:588 start_codon:yes stop_codon:yes gene_type:complete
MKSIYSINSGEGNKMYCLYHTFDDYRSYGVFQKTHHVRNLSTNFNKAITKAKNLFEEIKGENSKLIIGNEWELEEITRDGTADKKVEPVIVEKTEPIIQFPLSQKVGNVDEIKTFALGVTESFTFKGNFGTTLLTKFVDAYHNEFISFSQAKFMWNLKQGDTVYCTAKVKKHQYDYDENNNLIWQTHLGNIKGVN